MKRWTAFFSVILTLTLVFGIAQPLLAKPHVYKIDLVRFDLEDIQEPKGEGTVVVDLPDDIDPYTQQVLNDVITPVIVDVNEAIEKFAVEVQKTVDEFQEDPTEEKQEEVQKAIKQLNADYDKLIVTAQKLVEQKLEDKWKELQQENKELLKHNLKVGFKIAKEAFSITTAVARLVVSGGADISGYVQIVRSGMNLFSLAKTELEGLETKANNVKSKMDDLKDEMEKIEKTVDPKKRLAKNFVKNFVKKPTEKLEDANDELKLKMISSRKSIQNVAASLDSLLVATQSLPEATEEQKKKKAAAEKRIDYLINKIIKKHKDSVLNKELLKESEDLVKQSKDADADAVKIAQEISDNIQTAVKVAKGIKDAAEGMQKGVELLSDIVGMFT